MNLYKLFSVSVLLVFVSMFMLTGFVYADNEITTDVVSATSADVYGNNDSYNMSVSADGKYVVFSSLASNLVSGDTNSKHDIFLKDTITGEIQLISKASNGVIGDAGSFSPSISADGNIIAFVSNASNLVTGISGTGPFIYIVKRGTGEIALMDLDYTKYHGYYTRSVNAYETDFKRLSVLSISDDGSRIAFIVKSNLFGMSRQAAVYNIGDNTMKVVSKNFDGEYSEGGSVVMVDLSSNGKYLVFTSFAENLFPDGYDVGGEGSHMQNVFFSNVDGVSIAEVVDFGLDGKQPSSGAITGVAFNDGVRVAYLSSSGDIVDGDLEPQYRQHGYMYNRNTGRTEFITDVYGTALGYAFDLSPDEKFLAFVSNVKFDSLDVDNDEDIYVHDLQSSSNYLLSDIYVEPIASSNHEISNVKVTSDLGGSPCVISQQNDMGGDDINHKIDTFKSCQTSSYDDTVRITEVFPRQANRESWHSYDSYGVVSWLEISNFGENISGTPGWVLEDGDGNIVNLNSVLEPASAQIPLHYGQDSQIVICENKVAFAKVYSQKKFNSDDLIVCDYEISSPIEFGSRYILKKPNPDGIGYVAVDNVAIPNDWELPTPVVGEYNIPQSLIVDNNGGFTRNQIAYGTPGYTLLIGDSDESDTVTGMDIIRAKKHSMRSARIGYIRGYQNVASASYCNTDGWGGNLYSTNNPQRINMISLSDNARMRDIILGESSQCIFSEDYGDFIVMTPIYNRHGMDNELTDIKDDKEKPIKSIKSIKKNTFNASLIKASIKAGIDKKDGKKMIKEIDKFEKKIKRFDSSKNSKYNKKILKSMYRMEANAGKSSWRRVLMFFGIVI